MMTEALLLRKDITKELQEKYKFNNKASYINKSSDNTIELEKFDYKDFATDVEAGVAYLLGRKEINKKKIGLIGHSEGGVVAPMVAANSKNIAFIVLLAGTDIPGGELLQYAF